MTHRISLVALGILLCAFTAMPGRAESLSAPQARQGVQVQERVVLEQVHSPELGRPMPVYIYVPPDYRSAPGRRYPVVYMHDGAEAFRAGRRRAEWPDRNVGLLPETWDVAATLDRLFLRDPAHGAIVVAIDSVHRVEDFSPWPWSPAHEAAGRQYMDFIVRSLKPHIDARYRTLAGRTHTAMLGSSLGGVISMYGVIKFPDVFSKAAMLSPVFTPNVLGDELARYIEIRGPLEDVRIFMDVGGAESDAVKAGAERMYRTLLRRDFFPENLTLEVAAGGTHRVSSWRTRFPRALSWLFGW